MNTYTINTVVLMLLTRFFWRYPPLILAPAGGTWCLRRVLGPSRPYPLGLGPMKTSSLVSHGHIRGGVCFWIFEFSFPPPNYALLKWYFACCACVRAPWMLRFFWCIDNYESRRWQKKIENTKAFFCKVNIPSFMTIWFSLAKRKN